MANIEVAGLHKKFDNFTAVINSNFKIRDGEFFVILGPSGCGKTTTLRMIAGLELPTSGKILLDDEDVSFERASNRDIAFMFQMFALYPHMNVKENICFPLKCQGYSKAAIAEKLAEVARILRIEHILDNKISSLAGGDRQRVALGRAIIREPKAFLMDEPLGALDSEFRHDMTIELRELHIKMKATTVYVTHDQLEAMMLADRIMIMNHGIIEQIGTPAEIYNKPRSLFVAKFVGEPPMNFLSIESAVQKDTDHVFVEATKIAIPTILDKPDSQDLLLGFRPDQVNVSQTYLDNALNGVVQASEYFGTNQVLTIACASGVLKARIPAETQFKEGENVYVTLKPEKLIVFDEGSGQAVLSTYLVEK